MKKSNFLLKTSLIIAMTILFPIRAQSAAPAWPVTYTTCSVYFFGSITINNMPADEGDIVAAFVSGVSDPVSKFTITTTGQYGFMPIYGDDTTTDGVKDGALFGDEISFQIYDASADTIYNAHVSVIGGNNPPIYTGGLGDQWNLDLSAIIEIDGTVSINQVRGSTGYTITVPVRLITGQTIDTVDAFGFDVSFDPNDLRFVDFTRDALTQGFDNLMVSESILGNLRISGNTSSNIIPPGSDDQLLNLNFELLCPHGCLFGDTFPITLITTSIVDDFIGYSTTGGGITFGCQHDGDTNEDGAISMRDALNAFCHYMDDGNCSPDLPLTVCGSEKSDVNVSGSITPEDAKCIAVGYMSGIVSPLLPFTCN